VIQGAWPANAGQHPDLDRASYRPPDMAARSSGRGADARHRLFDQDSLDRTVATHIAKS